MFFIQISINTLFHQKINSEQIGSDCLRLNIDMGIYLDTKTFVVYFRTLTNEWKKENLFGGGINGKRKYDEACFLISCGEKTVLQSHHIRNGFKFVILTQLSKVSKYKQYKTYVLILTLLFQVNLKKCESDFFDENRV